MQKYASWQRCNQNSYKQIVQQQYIIHPQKMYLLKNVNIVTTYSGYILYPNDEVNSPFTPSPQ